MRVYLSHWACYCCDSISCCCAPATHTYTMTTATQVRAWSTPVVVSLLLHRILFCSCEAEQLFLQNNTALFDVQHTLHVQKHTCINTEHRLWLSQKSAAAA